MYVVELRGSPFDDRHALSVTADDGTQQTVYIMRNTDETATVVWDAPRPMRQSMEDGIYPESTVLVDER